MKVGEFCSRAVVIVYSHESLRAAAELMRRHHVGDLVVLEDGDLARRPMGLVTDRDLVLEAIAPGVDPDSITAADITVRDPVLVREEDDLLDTLATMRKAGVRRIPVVDGDGALAGILSVDDVLELLADILSDLRRLITREQENEASTRRTQEY